MAILSRFRMSQVPRTQHSLISAYLHPLEVASQVKEAEVLVLEHEPPIDKGSYLTYSPLGLEEEKWDWMSEVFSVISSPTFVARMDAGKWDIRQWTNLATLAETDAHRWGASGTSRISAANVHGSISRRHQPRILSPDSEFCEDIRV